MPHYFWNINHIQIDLIYNLPQLVFTLIVLVTACAGSNKLLTLLYMLKSPFLNTIQTMYFRRTPVLPVLRPFFPEARAPWLPFRLRSQPMFYIVVLRTSSSSKGGGSPAWLLHTAELYNFISYVTWTCMAHTHICLRPLSVQHSFHLFLSRILKWKLERFWSCSVICFKEIVLKSKSIHITS